MICAIFMICILSLSVMFVMYFNGWNKDIYLFIIYFNENTNFLICQLCFVTEVLIYCWVFDLKITAAGKIWLLHGSSNT